MNEQNGTNELNSPNDLSQAEQNSPNEQNGSKTPKLSEEMPFLAHFAELRARLIKSLLAVVRTGFIDDADYA